MTISRRSVLRVLGGTAIVAATAGLGLSQCDPMPAEAIAGWAGPTGETEPRRRALSYALLAPNPHNRQAWLADLREPGVITLWVDPERTLPMTDPYGRQVMIGCGCFLELALMSLAADGIGARLSLFPDGAAAAASDITAAPFARIVLDGPAEARDPLFDQVLKRRSAKVEYGSQAPDAAAIEALRLAATRDGITLTVTAETDRMTRLKQLARDAWRVEVDTDRTFAESVNLMRITGPEIAKHRDGIELHGPFFWFAKKFGLMSYEAQMEKDGFARNSARTFLDAQLDATPSFLWLTSALNDRRAQIESGRAYLRLNLKATQIGLAMAPISQILQEFPEMAALQNAFLKETATPPGATVQMFCRLGAAPAPDPTPRRPLDAILKS